jgi:hypothetical protein
LVSRRAVVPIVTLLVAVAGFGVAAPPTPDPASRLAAGDDASEYWDVTALFDSGHRFFARWMITNQGPGSASAIAIGHLVFPDGRVVPFKNGRLSGRWELSDDGRRIRVASSILDWSGSQGLVEIDKNKAGIVIELHFDRDARGPRDARAQDGAVGFDLLATNAAVHGSIWVKGMETPEDVSGRLVATHAWMDTSEHTLRRIEFFAPGEALAIYLSEALAPDGARRRQLVIERDGVVLVRSERFDLEIEPSAAANADDDYPLPAALRIVSPEVEGEIRFKSVLVAHDPMEALPQPFRFLLSFKSRPHRAWVDSAYEFRIKRVPVDAASDDTRGVAAMDVDEAERNRDREGPQGDTELGDRHDSHRPLALRGSGVTNISFTNPLRIE